MSSNSTFPDFDAALDAWPKAIMEHGIRFTDETEAARDAARQRVRDLYEAVGRERGALVPLARLGLEAHKVGTQSCNYDKYPAGRIIADGLRFGVITLSKPHRIVEGESPFPFPIETRETTAARAVLAKEAK